MRNGAKQKSQRKSQNTQYRAGCRQNSRYSVTSLASLSSLPTPCRYTQPNGTDFKRGTTALSSGPRRCIPSGQQRRLLSSVIASPSTLYQHVRSNDEVIVPPIGLSEFASTMNDLPLLPIRFGSAQHAMQRIDCDESTAQQPPEPLSLYVAVSGGVDSMTTAMMLHHWSNAHNTLVAQSLRNRSGMPSFVESKNHKDAHIDTEAVAHSELLKHHIPIHVQAVTVNHGLRASSAEECQFVQQKLNGLGMNCDIITLDWERSRYQLITDTHHQRHRGLTPPNEHQQHQSKHRSPTEPGNSATAVESTSDAEEGAPYPILHPEEHWLDLQNQNTLFASFSPQQRKSIQTKARALRYHALISQCVNFNFHALVTGHHLGDQQETMLMRLMRGSGLVGLAGIEPVVPVFHSHIPPEQQRDPKQSFQRPPQIHMLRPLLQFPKTRLLSTYVGFHESTPHPSGLADTAVPAWIEDPSNDDSRHERVKIRQILRDYILPDPQTAATQESHGSTSPSTSPSHADMITLGFNSLRQVAIQHRAIVSHFLSQYCVFSEPIPSCVISIPLNRIDIPSMFRPLGKEVAQSMDDMDALHSLSVDSDQPLTGLLLDLMIARCVSILDNNRYQPNPGHVATVRLDMLSHLLAALQPPTHETPLRGARTFTLGDCRLWASEDAGCLVIEVLPNSGKPVETSGEMADLGGSNHGTSSSQPAVAVHLYQVNQPHDASLLEPRRKPRKSAIDISHKGGSNRHRRQDAPLQASLLNPHREVLHQKKGVHIYDSQWLLQVCSTTSTTQTTPTISPKAYPGQADRDNKMGIEHDETVTMQFIPHQEYGSRITQQILQRIVDNLPAGPHKHKPAFLRYYLNEYSSHLTKQMKELAFNRPRLTLPSPETAAGSHPTPHQLHSALCDLINTYHHKTDHHLKTPPLEENFLDSHLIWSCRYHPSRATKWVWW